MHENIASTISQLVAPVVMISASGLMCLALFNRLAVLVARSRAFAKERVELLRALDEKPGGYGVAPDDGRPNLDRIRLGALETHAARVLSRAGLLRAALQALLAGVLAMLAASAGIGLSLLSPVFAVVALVAFFLGLALMAVGIALVMAELSQALRDVQFEDRILRGVDSPG